MSIIRTYIVPHPPIILPEIGKGSEKSIQKTIDAYHKVARNIATLKPDTILISSPHSTMYADYFHVSPGSKAFGNFKQFGANQINFEVYYDTNLEKLISKKAKETKTPIGTIGEKDASLDHGTMVPLYFIKQYYDDFNVLRISPSGLSLIDHYNAGRLINSVIPKDKKVIWVASGDLSHKLKEDGPYGLSKEGIQFDKQLVAILKSGNFSEVFNLKTDFCYKAAECGLGSFTMMMGAIDGYNIKPNVLSYEGPFGVGYAVGIFEKLEYSRNREYSRIYQSSETAQINLIREKEDEYVALARKSLEFYVKNSRKLPMPLDLNKELQNNKAGVFVSLHIDDRLRGCVGTISATTNSIAEEIIQNAISAGFSDYRFSKVKEEELCRIEYSVDVLLPAETIESMDQLDVKKYGVIVSNNYKSGLLLPNIDGVETVKEQIRIAKKKAGIEDSEKFKMERFEVVRHH
ncbi:AmmeMemoRadiSam system protein A [Mycoplasmatota bacterium WC30]